MAKITWTDFSNGDEALGIRNKINLLGQSVASFSTEVVNNLNVKTLIFLNKTVAVTAWASDSTYLNFPFKAAIDCTGVTANDTPLVMFSAADQESGNYTGADSGANVVYIYCSTKPTVAITIPNIIVLQGVDLNA